MKSTTEWPPAELSLPGTIEEIEAGRPEPPTEPRDNTREGRLARLAGGGGGSKDSVYWNGTALPGAYVFWRQQRIGKMKSLDRCPTCGRGYMHTKGTKVLKSGDRRVRRLRCSECGFRGKEYIDGPPRPRPKKKESKLDPTSTIPSGFHLPESKTSATIQEERDAAAHATRKETAMLYSIFQLGRKLDLIWHDVYDRVVDGDIPLSPLYVGTYARWPVAAVESWIAGGCQPGEELSDEDYCRLQSALLAELKFLDENRKE